MSTWTVVVFFPGGDYAGRVTHKLRLSWKIIPCKYAEPYLGAYVVGSTQVDPAMLFVIRNGDRHTAYLNRLGKSLHFILSFLLAGLQSSGPAGILLSLENVPSSDLSSHRCQSSYSTINGLGPLPD